MWRILATRTPIRRASFVVDTICLGRRWYVIGGEYRQKWSYFNNPGEPLIAHTIGNALDEAAVSFASREAVVDRRNNVRKTFAQLKRDVDELAAGLLALGLKPGDRIGILGPNNYEWVLTQLAAAKSALILVNVNPAYKSDELEYCLAKVGMRALVSYDVFKTQNYYEMLCSIVPSLSTSKPGEISDNKLRNLTHVIMISKGREKEEYRGTFKFQDVAKMAETVHFEELEKLQNVIQFDDPVNIQFTSGTTGRAKCVALTHHRIVNNCNYFSRILGYDRRIHRLCVNVPLFHIFGSVGGTMASVLFGACQVFPAEFFRAEECARAIHEEKCTSIYGTPTMFIDLLNLKNLTSYDLSSLETGLMGGSVCPEEVMKATIDKLNVSGITIGYGSTESGPSVFQTLRDDPLEKRVSTVGMVAGHTEVKIVDPTSRTMVGCGTVGELWTRGLFVMRGYWNDPESTKQSITKDGWYKTGDLAVADEDGYFRIVGRLKEMIIRGGENIYPREIEQYLHTHRKIAAAYVVGVPDQRMGEEVCAWIRLKENEKMTTQELIDYCKEKIAHYKIPRYVKFTDNFPMTVTGKVKKSQLTAMSIEEFGLAK